MIFLHRVAQRGSQEKQKQVRVAAVRECVSGFRFQGESFVANQILVQKAGAAAGKDSGNDIERRVVVIVLVGALVPNDQQRLVHRIDRRHLGAGLGRLFGVHQRRQWPGL